MPSATDMFRFFPHRAVAVVSPLQAQASLASGDIGDAKLSHSDSMLFSAGLESNHATGNRNEVLGSFQAGLQDSMAEETNPEQTSLLFSLPIELRDEIYRLYFSTSTLSARNQPHTQGCFDLLLVNRQIYNEARAAMRRDAVFTINLAFQYCRHRERNVLYHMHNAILPQSMLPCSSRALEDFTKFYIHLEAPPLWVSPQRRHWEHTLCCLLAPEWNVAMYRSKAFHVSIDMGCWSTDDQETKYMLQAARHSRSVGLHLLVENREILYCENTLLTEAEKNLLKRKAAMWDSIEPEEQAALARYALLCELAKRALEIPGAEAIIENRRNGTLIKIKPISTFALVKECIRLSQTSYRTCDTLHLVIQKGRGTEDSHRRALQYTATGKRLRSRKLFSVAPCLELYTKWGWSVCLHKFHWFPLWIHRDEEHRVPFY